MAWRDVTAHVQRRNEEFFDTRAGMYINRSNYQVKKIPIYHVENDARPPDAIADWGFVIEEWAE